MTVPVGGLRARLVRDSFYNFVREGVVARGWTDAGRKHKPYQFIAAPTDWNEEIPFNSIAVSAENVQDEEVELGSNLTDDTWTYYIDLYAESNNVGMDCAHDVRDMLRGKIPSIDRSLQAFPVLDYRMATPQTLFWCNIENVVLDRARDFPQAWRKNWFSIRCDVIDTYADELDDDPLGEGGIVDGGFPDDSGWEPVLDGGAP